MLIIGIVYPKLSKLPLKVQEDILDSMADSVARKIVIGSNAKIAGLEEESKIDDIIEIDGMMYHCHPAVSNLLNSLWEQIEGMKRSIKTLENAKN